MSVTETSNVKQSQATSQVESMRALCRVLLRTDLRDVSTLIFTFLFPAGLLVALVLAFGDIPSADGGDSVNQVSANVVAFGIAFVGAFAGATHLALWRENGMFRVMRTFPISVGTVLMAQATVGVMLALAQSVFLVVVGVTPWLGMTLAGTAPIALLALVLGYLMFFFLGVLIGILVPSMAAVSMLATIIIIPLGFAGGAMMPLEGLPGWLQDIAPFTPIYHLREAVTVPLVGAGEWADAAIGGLYMIGAATILYFVVRSVFRWK